ncbi:MAG: hypothetical protein ACK4NC_01160 [Candidatus Gracilibacteria bacterium]
MTTQDIITYFKSIASTSSEELYIERIFAKGVLSIEDVAFLTTLQEKQIAALEKDTQEIDKALEYLEFDEKDILKTMDADEESDEELKSAIYQEAFTLRSTHSSSKDNKAATNIISRLLNRK